MAMEINDQVLARLAKLDKLRENGINPYPYKFDRTHTTKELKEQQEALLESQETVRFAGRVVRANGRGKMFFMHLKDQEGRLQVLAAKQDVSEQDFMVVKQTDLGDWVGVEGKAFITRTGEFTIVASKFEVLSKAIRPLPVPKEKVDEEGNKVIFDEFKDVDTRYRQRYIDLTLNDGVREVFLKRSKIVSTIRHYLEGLGYLEVDTPSLQTIYGGANARPFMTHHNAADIELYLRVSNELFLKRCIVGGLEKVFEFSRNFRNEGMDRTHNPEFTAVEFYESYADYNDMMVHFETIWEKACLAANGTTEISFMGQEISLKAPWKRMTCFQALQEIGGLDVESLSDDDLKAELKKHHIEMDGEFSRGRAILALFEELCEDKLIQPTFITDFPKESTPLCKRHRDNPDLVEQFEPYICGMEIGNAYSELNDPVLQREALEEQVERGRGGEDETHPLDENFLHAIESGMPPTGGVGIGIDRMVMILTDSHTIRDVLLFPLMKPES